MTSQILFVTATASRRASACIYWLALMSITLLASNICVMAQNSYAIGTPASSRAGQSTASTYAMDKLETINLANGNMSVHIPLVTIGGRGSAGYTLALSYNSKLWSAEQDTDPGYTDPAGQPRVGTPSLQSDF